MLKGASPPKLNQGTNARQQKGKSHKLMWQLFQNK